MYRYFHVKEGLVIGYIESSVPLESSELIPVNEENEKHFGRKDTFLVVKDGKIYEAKEIQDESLKDKSSK